MVFTDRIQAAQLLAQRLADYAGRNPLVLAIPRGAVPMGQVIADGARRRTRRGAGAQARGARQSGIRHRRRSTNRAGPTSRPMPGRRGADAAYIERQKEAELARIRQRRARVFAAASGRIDPAGRIVIVIDDGLATGSTMIAALHALRTRKPAEAHLRRAGGAAGHPASKVGANWPTRWCACEAPDDFRAVGPVLPRLRPGRGRRGDRDSRVRHGRGDVAEAIAPAD
ncbi:MAG: phosphoribosyltransferase [Comamonadaceae bacterium]|nr:phosphoribosyltransferase [Comamonadaceae bacterium]